MTTDPVTVELKDLEQGKVDNLLPQAFGPDSLGIIVVKGLPEKFHSLREKVLKSASELAKLPKHELEKLESPEAYWLVGWSCGKEKLVDGKPDELKGSYYINCAFHHDENLEGPPEDVVKSYPDLTGYTAKNMWPSSELIPEFEKDIKQLINLIINTAAIVAKACDRYVGDSMPGYEKGYLERIVNTSTTTKARLLHYFAPVEQNSSENDWCGEHVDHSCLTGLTSAMFVDDKEAKILDKSPDPNAGLYIKNRQGNVVKVGIPKDALAFQTGEALESVTNGQFKAVPHFVKGSETLGVSRNTLAVFCQPSLDEKVGKDLTFAEFSRQVINKNH